MRGRGNSSGRGQSRGRGVQQVGRRHQIPPKAYPPNSAANPQPPAQFTNVLVMPPQHRFNGSPSQMRHAPSAGPPPPFRLSPRTTSRRPPGNFGKHPSVPIHSMYGSDGMIKLPMPSPNHPPFPKAMPYGGRMPQGSGSRPMSLYERSLPKDHPGMQSFHGMVPPMMMGQFMPIYSMPRGPGGAEQESTSMHHPGSGSTWKRGNSPKSRRTMGTRGSDETHTRRPMALDRLVDSTKVHAKLDIMVHMLSRIEKAMDSIRIAIPSIFRVRNNFKLRREEEKMIATVDEVFRYLLLVHLSSYHKLYPPFEIQKAADTMLRGKEPLIQFVGSKGNIAVVDIPGLHSVVSRQPLNYNPEWFVVRWEDPYGESSGVSGVNKRPFYVRSFVKPMVDGRKRAVFLKSINVSMFEEHMDMVTLMCKKSSASRDAMLRAIGYYAICCEDDPFINLATSILPEMEAEIQVQFYRQIAELLDTTKYRLGSIYLERYYERILPMCLAVQDPAAWSPTIKMLMNSVDSLRLGSKNSSSATTLLRTLKSWCNVFVRCEETCLDVFNKCIQLVLQAGDDSRIVVRGAAADLAVQIWLNAKGKEAVVKKIGYETIRILGCISGVQSIKFNIWSDLLSPESSGDDNAVEGPPQLERLLSRVGHYDAVVQSLPSEEAGFVSSMLTAEPSILGNLMNWYLLRYCKITKTVLALEKIATVIRFALMAYPRLAKTSATQINGNVGTFCCWMLNIAVGCSVGSGCLELANVKMALFVDWLFFNYQYNARIIRLCLGPQATSQCDLVLQNMHICRRLFVKEIAKCIYTIKRPDIPDDNEHLCKINVLFGTNAVLMFAYNTAVDTFKRLVDYMLNAIIHYHSEVGVVAIDTISAIFVVSVMELKTTEHTLLTLQRALRSTMLGRMCSVLDISLEGIIVHIAHVDDMETQYMLQPKSALEPIQERYTMVTSIADKRRNMCYDETLKMLLLQCYGMILEYVINYECLNAIYHGNHLTSDTLQANHEIQLLEHMQCPKLYTNITIVNSEIDPNLLEDDLEDTTEMEKISDIASDISDSESGNSLSDISSDECGPETTPPAYPQDDAIEEGQILVEPGQHKDTTVDVEMTDERLNISPAELRQLVQDFVHTSMDNCLKDSSQDLLYSYLKLSMIAEGPPDYKLVVDHKEDLSIALKWAHPNSVVTDEAKTYRAANAIDVVVSYLLETALQCLQDDASKGASVDSILFKEWVVHIFNVFVRLFISLYLAGNMAIVWELIYYIAAVSIVIEQKASHKQMGTDVSVVLRKKRLIATTLLSNTIDALTQIQSIDQDAVISKVLSHVIRRTLTQTNTEMATMINRLMPIRYTLEILFKNCFEHLGKLPSIVGIMVQITPVAALNVLIPVEKESHFNVFKEPWLMQGKTAGYIKALLSGTGNPLRIRQFFILWQIICRMYEMAFGTQNMRPTLKQNRSFLKITSNQVTPKNIARLPYVTEGDICDKTMDKKSIVCFLGTSNNRRSSFMTYQKGYTFVNDLFINEHLHTISGGILDALNLGDVSMMQIALFSAYPILVHSVPPKEVVRDITDCVGIIWSKKRDRHSLPVQYIREMFVALLSSWLTRFPELLASYDHGLDQLPDAVEMLGVKYTSGRNMQFAFNGTIIKVPLEHLLALKMSL
ncbi:SF3A3 splicing factor subunit 3, putative [Babesia ovis]|uniref:SF3A3 splicing factor subunit 3, putative n=1 Tax=Babesia ovis TaxID=5869 RepID=A0A9W5T899_BABOV|nr:SF3A3 splicing factor subunit 3, putative [Babesia ovis]